MDKSEFIGAFLDKKMKGHNLPYGMEYLNKLDDATEKAEKAWLNKQKKLKTQK